MRTDNQLLLTVHHHLYDLRLKRASDRLWRRRLAEQDAANRRRLDAWHDRYIDWCLDNGINHHVFRRQAE